MTLEHTIAVDDFQTALERWGDGGPAILAIHGIGSSRRDAARLGRALDGRARVYAYDQPGHGDSAASRAPLDLAHLARIARGVIDSIGHVDYLIGHSWGGAVALVTAAATDLPVLLIDPLLRVEPGTFHEYVDDLAELLVDPPGPERERAVRAAYADADPADVDAKVHALRALDPRQIARLGEENDADGGGWDVTAALAGLRVPPCVALAGHDSVVGERERASLPKDALVRVFEGRGHTLHRSAFPEYLALVERYFALP